MSLGFPSGSFKEPGMHDNWCPHCKKPVSEDCHPKPPTPDEIRAAKALWAIADYSATDGNIAFKVREPPKEASFVMVTRAGAFKVEVRKL